MPCHHRNHPERCERECNDCHRQQSCQRCHVHGSELHPMGEPSASDLPGTCFRCHGDWDCEECHGRDADDIFDHADVGWPPGSYHENQSCCNCRGHARGVFIELDTACDSGHQRSWDPASFNNAARGVALDELHGEAECLDCHEEGIGGPTGCRTRHDDDRRCDPERGLGS